MYCLVIFHTETHLTYTGILFRGERLRFYLINHLQQTLFFSFSVCLLYNIDSRKSVICLLIEQVIRKDLHEIYILLCYVK